MKKQKNDVCIYDPLTNPELVFKYNDYMETIMPNFSLVARPAQAMDLIETQELAMDFMQKWTGIEQQLRVLLSQQAELTAAQLLQDPNFTDALLNNAIPLEKWQEVVNKALKIVEKKALQSKVDNNFPKATEYSKVYKSINNADLSKENYKYLHHLRFLKPYEYSKLYKMAVNTSLSEEDKEFLSEINVKAPNLNK